MKKLIFTLLISVFTFVASAQRIKNAPKDNTYRQATFYGTPSGTSVSYKSTIAIPVQPVFRQVHRIDLTAVTDSSGTSTITCATSAAKLFDELTLVFDSVSAQAASRVITFSTGFAPNGTMTLVTSKRGTIRFVYDAVTSKWVELFRTTSF